MADNHNFAALEWLVREIGESLKEARHALESYVENPSDSTRIRFCLTHIHQVHGSLQMVEFYGAAMLASEMEQLAQAMLQGTVTSTSEAQEVLMRSILQFPLYLDQVKATRKDNPLVVLPLLNDLRAVRGESLLTDTKLFMPNLAAARKISGERLPISHNNSELQAMAHKLRQMYQYAASAYIRDQDPEQNLAYLHKAFSRLQKLTQGTARFAIWDISLALVEALEKDALEISVAVKNLLRQLDKEIKILAVHGTRALASLSNEELLKNLLYYVARAGKHITRLAPDSHLLHIYQRYELEEALLEGPQNDGDQHAIAAPDADAMRSVVSALKDELNIIKEALDASLGHGETPQELIDALPIVKRIADTLAILGLGNLRKQLLEQGAVLELYAESRAQLHDDQLMAVADQILQLENALDNLGETPGQAPQAAPLNHNLTLVRAQESVLRESRNGLEQAKDAIVEYIATQWNREHLEKVPGILREIRGGLDMVPLPRPARVLNACASYIEEQLLAREGNPQWETLDTLADAITSVEYYLERISSGARKEENDLLLGVAEDSIASLGYKVAAETPAAAEPDTNWASDAAEAPATSDDDLLAEALLHSAQDIAAALAQEAPNHRFILPESSANAAFAELAEAHLAQADSDELIPEIEALTLDVLPEAPDDTQAAAPEPVAEHHAEPEPELIRTSDAPVISRDNDDIDDEIIEIFIEEAEEVVAAIDEHFPRWAANFEESHALNEFRRAFHTLKGSGRMVGANDIGELAWSIENMLNRIIDRTITPGALHSHLINEVRGLLPAMIAAFRDNQPNPNAEVAETYRQQAHQLAQGHIPTELQAAAAAQAPQAPAPEPELAAEALPLVEASFDDDESDPLLEAEANLIEAGLIEASWADADLAENLADEDDSEDDDNALLWDIFGTEATTHLQVVQAFISHMEAEAPIYEPPSDATQRALHTLKGSAHMAEITPVAELVTPLERFVKELRSYHVNINEDILQLLRDAVSYTQSALAQIKAGETVEIPRLQLFVARVNELRELYITPLVHQQELDENGKRPVDPKLLAMFMAEEMNLLLDADQILAHWSNEPGNTQPLLPITEELGKLTQAAAQAYLPIMAGFSEKLHSVYEAILAQHLGCNGQVFNGLVQAHGALLDMVDAIAAGQNLQAAPAAVEEQLDELLSNEVMQQLASDSLQDAVTAPEAEAEAEAEKPAPFAADIPLPDNQITPWTPEAKSAPAVSEPADESGEDSDFDPEIVDIFIEEAGELLEDIDRALLEWQDDWNNSDSLEELKRSLHTFKGGARLAGLTELGDLSHNFETMLIELDSESPIDQPFFSRVNRYQDQLHTGVELIQARLNGEQPPALPSSLQAPPAASNFVSVDEAISATPYLSASELGEIESLLDQPDEADDSEAPAAETPRTVDNRSADNRAGDSRPSDNNVLAFTPKTKAPPASGNSPSLPSSQPGSEFGAARASMPGNQPQHLAARRSGPQEVVKVSAELLEELVNLAGETSISRGRMEQQVGDLSHAIDEMDSTIKRLQEQLRRLDIETEAQVLFRQEQMAQHEEFDPLEMDRYSQLQQLSRSLIESASDLMDLKYTLVDKTRDAETLLLQQSRINTDLQEGLMRSRMVPFSRLVPRLRRIVRQAASELGKEVEFDLDNVEGELDRSMLERMVAPLEHMLRNAVDHGIEPPEVREAKGKNASGRILLSLGREGGDVIIRLIDNGRGINLQRVREKAIERGLMSADSPLSDQDIMQFIVHAGFSTAEKVTQISGRGVGMDVVHSEIKLLGGSMHIDSRWGEGTEFTIRLPFTVSVNRALMVQIGDDFYAIPLNTIEGIVRVSPFELEHYYQEPEARFEYAGERYLVRYLGAMLDSSTQPKLDSQVLPLPVVLVRSAESTVALQVDRLLGSREIVVKTLGAQFSAVRGISGATVMGDGSVVVILDLHALMREQLALGNQPQLLDLNPANSDDSSEKLVMVVDDSVTVRKVTSRFLEREGFQVITAKDGAEAMQLLQDQVPDLMLLDIEMPRMDGFEVAKNVRGSSRLRHLPIIMITSRTGEKHRERALSLGVNKYMGKPYQEDVLLENIRELLGKRAH